MLMWSLHSVVECGLLLLQACSILTLLPISKSEVFLVPSLEVEQCGQNKISFVSEMPWNIRRVNTMHCALTVENATILEIGVV